MTCPANQGEKPHSQSSAGLDSNADQIRILASIARELDQFQSWMGLMAALAIIATIALVTIALNSFR